MIKAVLFDYGGVLTEAGRKGSVQKTIAELFGIDIGWEKLDDWHDKLRRGAITTEEFFQGLSAAHNSTRKISEREWNELSKEVFERSEPVYALAASLRQHCIKTGILSNVYAMTAGLLRQLGNYDGFAPVVLSCDTGLVKPDPAIYRLAADKLNVRPDEIIFVDDQEKCMPPAQALGIHTVLARDPAQTVREVRAILRDENGLDL